MINLILQSLGILVICLALVVGIGRILKKQQRKQRDTVFNNKFKHWRR